jgi:SAM-dependent methyltransferase
MDGYTDSTYGDRFADVYDDWYHDVSDIGSTVDFLTELASPSGRVLELGVGTGRLALPLSDRGVTVVGVDSSAAMLAKLAAKDSQGAVQTVLGDMVDDMPDGPFDVIFVAYNTFFGLLSAQRQAACFATVAQRLATGGAFVIEAFVPNRPDPETEHGAVTVRSITTDRVVLAVSRHDSAAQTASGQYVEITEGGGVRLRPWQIRFSAPAELDRMAAAAGLVVTERHEQFDRTPFDVDSPRHVTVYRTIHSSVRPSSPGTS